MKSLLRTLTGLILIAVSVSAQTEKPIVLPRPQTDGGKPLMQVLKERQSGREFSSEKLPPQLLSNLLWAAWGVNRPDGRRTAPSASNRQEIDIYVATPEGLYLYNATDHQLQPLVKEDLRAATGRQPYVGQAALNLIYVADQTRMDGRTIAPRSPTPVSSARTFTFSALRKDWRPWSAGASTANRCPSS